MKCLTPYIYIIGIVFLFGCASGSGTATTPSPYAPDAIRVSYKSDSLLNAYDGAPHALRIVVYQLDCINGFNDFSKSKDGLLMLLSAKSFDSSVLSVDTFSIEPASNGTLSLARVEKTAWVGLAAGYNGLEPDKSTRFYQIPVKKARHVPVVSDPKPEPQTLDMSVVFTSDSVQDNPLQNPPKPEPQTLDMTVGLASGRFQNYPLQHGQ